VTTEPEPAPSPRRRGRPPRFTRVAVVAAAREIVEREGIGALSMRRVATELDSSPMAIYRHVRDKDELLVLLLDALAREVPRPALSRDPRTRLHQVCRAMHDGLAEHAWVVEVLAQGDLIAPSILWLVEEIVAGLMTCGLSPAGAADGYRAIWQFTVGELLISQGVARTASLGRMPFVLSVLTSVDPDELPALAAVAGEWAGARERDAYDVGLAAVINGLIGQEADDEPEPR
jgi:AcrR family transcriptional regulator